MKELIPLGWNDYFAGQLTAEDGALTVARIVEPLRGLSRAIYTGGEIWAEHTEKSATGAKSREAVPAIGDWVVGSLRDFGGGEMRMTISRLLTRKNKLSRAATGGKVFEQILCANADVAFLVLAHTQGLNLSAVGRYLEIFNDCGVVPVIVVTKTDDGAEGGAETIAALKAAAPGVALHSISVKERRGLDALNGYFSGHKTVVLCGMSGAGKSTLTNYLLREELQRVEAIRESDQKGRHTTTGRRLHLLPNGGMVVDAPGIREIQKWVEPVGGETEKKKPKGGKTERRYKYDEDDY